MPLSLRALLNEVVVKNASDLHIGVGVPPVMRIDGSLRAVEGAGVPTGQDIEAALMEVISRERMARFKEDLELDFSFAFSGPEGTEPRFRGNCFF